MCILACVRTETPRRTLCYLSLSLSYPPLPSIFILFFTELTTFFWMSDATMVCAAKCFSVILRLKNVIILWDGGSKCLACHVIVSTLIDDLLVFFSNQIYICYIEESLARMLQRTGGDTAFKRRYKTVCCKAGCLALRGLVDDVANWTSNAATPSVVIFFERMLCIGRLTCDRLQSCLCHVRPSSDLGRVSHLVAPVVCNMTHAALVVCNMTHAALVICSMTMLRSGGLQPGERCKHSSPHNIADDAAVASSQHVP
jgi:hypothetical protein